MAVKTECVCVYTKQMSTYSNRLQPALQNLLCVVWFFPPEIVMHDAYIGGHSENKINALCLTISGGRTKELNMFCRVTGFTSDFLSFIVVELIRFFTEPSILCHFVADSCSYLHTSFATTRMSHHPHYASARWQNNSYTSILVY